MTPYLFAIKTNSLFLFQLDEDIVFLFKHGNSHEEQFEH